MKIKLHFCDVHFSWGKKQIRKNTCFKQQTFWSVQCFFFFEKSYFQPSMFFDPKRRKKHEQRAHLGGSCFELGPQNFQWAHSDPKCGPQRAHSEFWREPKGSGPCGHRVAHEKIKTGAHTQATSSLVESGGRKSSRDRTVEKRRDLHSAPSVQHRMKQEQGTHRKWNKVLCCPYLLLNLRMEGGETTQVEWRRQWRKTRTRDTEQM